MIFFKGVCKGLIDNQIVLEVEDYDILRYFQDHIGADLKIEVKKWSDKRTLTQNALYWACIHELAKALNVSTEKIHLMMLRQTQKPETLLIRKECLDDFKEQWRTFEIVGYTTNDNGEEMAIINAYFGSHLLDKEEFAHLLDVLIAEMAEVDLRPPSRQMKEYLNVIQN